MDKETYIKAQIRIDQLINVYSYMTDEEQEELGILDRACEEHENKLMKDMEKELTARKIENNLKRS